jgi:hypothetical protein
MTKDPTDMNENYTIALADSGAVVFSSGDSAADLEAAFTKHEVTGKTRLAFWTDGSLLSVTTLGEALKLRSKGFPAKYR